MNFFYYLVTQTWDIIQESFVCYPTSLWDFYELQSCLCLSTKAKSIHITTIAKNWYNKVVSITFNAGKHYIQSCFTFLDKKNMFGFI